MERAGYPHSPPSGSRFASLVPCSAACSSPGCAPSMTAGSSPSSAPCPTLPSDAHSCGTCRRSEEHTSELQSLMRISYAVFCLKKKKHKTHTHTIPYIAVIHTHSIEHLLNKTQLSSR